MLQEGITKSKGGTIEIDASSDDDNQDGQGGIKWQWLEEAWPRDSRPPILRIKSNVEEMSIQELTLMHDMHLKQQKSENSKFSMLKKDELPPRIKFGEDKDDGKAKLHKARWLRLPFSEPKMYYDQVTSKKINEVRFKFSWTNELMGISHNLLLRGGKICF